MQFLSAVQPTLRHFLAWSPQRMRHDSSVFTWRQSLPIIIFILSAAWQYFSGAENDTMNSKSRKN
jgi:hypothetical protein